ncbi:MAG: DUF3135 domain-containing protein [Motiliproteus sp.]
MTQLPCFDDLKMMADLDPEGFEEFRRQSCEDFIKCLPKHHRQRLQAVQFRVDYEISKAKNPMAGLVKISGMMHDSFYQLSEKVHLLSDMIVTAEAPEQKPQKSNIVELSEWSKSNRLQNRKAKKR